MLGYSGYSLNFDLMTQSLGWTLLHFMWQGAVIAALLAVALHSLRRHSAAGRYAMCGAAMLMMTAAPAVTFFSLAGSPAAWIARPQVRHAAVSHSHHGFAPLIRPDDPLTAAIPWLVAAWLAGVGVLVIRLAGGWVHVQRYKRRAVRTALGSEAAGGWQETVERLKQRLDIRGAVRVVESAAAAVPTTIGWLRPVILMPAAVATGLTPQQLEVVIAHELAHIRRHDYLVNLLQCVVETLLFYHPGVWWVSGRMREEREYCCDDLAVAVCGNPVVYARTLTSLETLRAGVPALSLSSTGGPLMNRVCRIVGLGAARRRRAAICLIPCALCGAVGVAAAATAALFAANAEDARKLAEQQAAAEAIVSAEQDAPALWSWLLEPLLQTGKPAQDAAGEGELWLIGAADGERSTIASHPPLLLQLVELQTCEGAAPAVGAAEDLPLMQHVPLIGHLAEQMALQVQEAAALRHVVLRLADERLAEGQIELQCQTAPTIDGVWMAQFEPAEGEIEVNAGQLARCAIRVILAEEAAGEVEVDAHLAMEEDAAAEGDAVFEECPAVDAWGAPILQYHPGTPLILEQAGEFQIENFKTLPINEQIRLVPPSGDASATFEWQAAPPFTPVTTATVGMLLRGAGDADAQTGTLAGECRQWAVAALPEGFSVLCEPGPDCEVGPVCEPGPNCPPMPGCEPPAGCEGRACVEMRCVEQNGKCELQAGVATGRWVRAAGVLRNLTVRPILVKRVKDNGEETIAFEIVTDTEEAADEAPAEGPK